MTSGAGPSDEALTVPEMFGQQDLAIPMLDVPYHDSSTTATFIRMNKSHAPRFERCVCGYLMKCN